MASKLYSKLKPNTQSSVLVDPQYPTMELTIYRLFKIDLINLIKTLVVLAKNFHLQPSEMMQMPMWQYEYFLDAVNKNIDEENKRNEEEQSKYDSGKYNPKSMMKEAQSGMPKMPSMGSGFKPPKMPKL